VSAVEVRDALIALLNAAPSSASANAYTRQQLEDLAAPPAYYTEVWLSERLAENHRAGGVGPATAWRLITRAVGQYEDSAEEVRRRASARLLEASVTVGSVESTIITRAVSDDPIAPDDGWYSGVSEWQFYL